MMINFCWLLLARCCCISMLFLSLALTTTSNAALSPVSSVLLALKSTDSSSNTNSKPEEIRVENDRYVALPSSSLVYAKKTRPKRTPQQKQYTEDDCLSGHPRLPAPEGRPVLVSKRQGQWRCEFKIHIALPDIEHLIQLNFTTFRSPVDMRDYSAQLELQQRQENRNRNHNHTNTTNHTATTTTAATGSVPAYNGNIYSNNYNTSTSSSKKLPAKSDDEINVISPSSSSSSQLQKLQQQRTRSPSFNTDHTLKRKKNNSNREQDNSNDDDYGNKSADIQEGDGPSSNVKYIDHSSKHRVNISEGEDTSERISYSKNNSTSGSSRRNTSQRKGSFAGQATHNCPNKLIVQDISIGGSGDPTSSTTTKESSSSEAGPLVLCVEASNSAWVYNYYQS